jgi:hypothetical protein
MTRVATFIAVALALVAAAQAQPVSTSISSVEWAAVHSPLIVRGVIDDVSVHALKDGLHPNQGVHRYQTVSVRVLETLRGEHSGRLQFVHDGDFGTFRLANLQKNQQELLLFLEPWIISRKFNRASGGYAYTRFEYVTKDVIVLDPEESRWAHTSVPLLDSKRTRLSKPLQVIDTINTYLKNRQEQAPARGVTTLLPAELRGGYYQVSFTFPGDAAGERAIPDASAKVPILDFAEFRQKFAKMPPAEKKPAYLRDRGGYIGVYALELMAADCDAIVRAVIDDFCFVSRSDDPTGDSYGVKLRVLEAFKGKSASKVTCFVSDARDLADLRRKRQELVLFLRDNRREPTPHPAGGLEYRARAGLWDDSVIVLNKESAEVLFADLSWQRDPEKILTRLRAAAGPVAERDQPDNSRLPPANATLPMFDVHPPASIAAGSSIAGNPYAVIYLPVNGALEKSARQWATAEQQDLRWLATRALVYFKSDENAAILKRLLADEATWERREMLHLTGLSYPYEPEFLVRFEAWHVLSGWGYEFPRPEFRRRPR